MRSRRSKLVACLILLIAANVWLQGAAASCAMSAVFQPRGPSGLQSGIFRGKALKRVDHRGLSFEQSWRVEIVDEPDRGTKVVVRLTVSTARFGKKVMTTSSCSSMPTVSGGGVYGFVTRGLVDGEYDARSGNIPSPGRHYVVSEPPPGYDDGTGGPGWTSVPPLAVVAVLGVMVVAAVFVIRFRRRARASLVSQPASHASTPTC
jgi:hypothetical protein